jgi:Fe-Mn family superoxide dismutase
MFTTKTFSIGPLSGISEKNIEEHLKLYAGYVKNANLIVEKIEEYKKDSEKYAYELGELVRRFSFEYNGIRNHELYFSQFEGGKNELSEGNLKSSLEKQYGSLENFLNTFKGVAMTRGVGWVMLYHDLEVGKFIIQWIDEQHLGHLGSLSPILALDMWEHSFVYDYPTSEKKKYIEAFFDNLNWSVVEKRF